MRTVQLLESGSHDPKVSTVRRIAEALGYPSEAVDRSLESLFSQPPDSIAMASERMLSGGEDAWKVWLMNAVDAFRREKDLAFVETPPACGLSRRLEALTASTVEALCDELGLAPPAWCGAVLPLSSPWFVSGLENLKASAIAESPVHFRKRNVFVLMNFLSRR